jgi:hypothetical protein
MMIMGMCLQGILANPSLTGANGDPMTDEQIGEQLEGNVRLAHRYAAKLEGPTPEAAAADRIAALTRFAYGAIVAAATDGSGQWLSYEQARVSQDDTDLDRLDGVFERVSRWFHDPVGFPETTQDRIIAAIVAAGRE